MKASTCSAVKATGAGSLPIHNGKDGIGNGKTVSARSVSKECGLFMNCDRRAAQPSAAGSGSICDEQVNRALCPEGAGATCCPPLAEEDYPIRCQRHHVARWPQVASHSGARATGGIVQGPNEIRAGAPW
jgi:hypothetical protein